MHVFYKLDVLLTRQGKVVEMTQADFGTALTYQTLKGYEAGWSRPVAGVSTWMSISVMATDISKFDVLVTIRMIGVGGTWAGRPDPKTDLEKQAVGYEPGRHLLVFGTSTLLS
jgi:hypothetical protein